MKKLSWEQRRRHLRIMEKRDRREELRRYKRAIMRGARPTRRSRLARRARSLPSPLRVLAPERFLAEEGRPRTELVAMLEVIRRRVLSGRRVHIDFTPTRKMFPCGTLLFWAELDRLKRRMGGRRLISATRPAVPVVEQVLHQVGLIDLVGLTRRLDPSTYGKTVRHWRSVSGSAVEGRMADPIHSAYGNKLGRSQWTKLYDGIVEAMDNCISHAYVRPRPDGTNFTLKRWWMFTQELDGKLTVAVCDLGIGIPESLPTSKWWGEALSESLLARVGLASPDGDIIKAAVELHATRTGEENRGKGLRDILAVVKRSGSGHLRIMSNHGFYDYQGDTKVERVRDHPSSIGGTIVLWSLPLPETP